MASSPDNSPGHQIVSGAVTTVEEEPGRLLKKSKQRNIINIGDEFTIDEDDCRAVQAVLASVGRDSHIKKIRWAVKIREDDPQYRVSRLYISIPMWEGPILAADRSAGLDSAPRCLRRDIPYNDVHISESLSKLSNLTYLEIYKGVSYRTGGVKLLLPSSIGELKNLQILVINEMALYELPYEIGNLLSLKALNLRATGIKSIPFDIGNLANLQGLSLSDNEIDHFPDLRRPHETLKRLDLDGTKISSLSDSFGWMVPNLERLDLSYTEISKIPESMGNLKHLKLLEIHHTSVESLPNSFRILPVGQLHLYGCLMINRMSVVRSFRSLGFLSNVDNRKLDWELARNRSWSRTGFGIRNEHSVPMVSSKLWPRLLAEATRAFDFFDYAFKKFAFSECDAIYQLLIDGTESFLEAIIHRIQQR